MSNRVTTLCNRVTRSAVSAVVVVLTMAGCGDTGGTPTAESGVVESSTSSATTAATTTATTTATMRTSAPPTTQVPAGPPIGTATMKVTGSGQATISYQINGGATQVEPNAVLPWQRDYPVYNEISSSVTADGGDAELTCSIVMDGQLVSFKTEPKPTCSFAYY